MSRHTESDDFIAFAKSLEPQGDLFVDSVDLEALSQLTGEELLRAESALLEMLEERDYRALDGLVTIDSRLGARTIGSLMPTLAGQDRVMAAGALWRLTGDAGAVAHLLDELANGEPAGRREAAKVLADVTGPRVVTALLAALNKDPDKDVRWQAATSALAISGVIAHIWSDELRQLRLRLLSDDMLEAERARKEIEELIRGSNPPMKT